jgi:uncharacterized protein YcfJ
VAALDVVFTKGDDMAKVLIAVILACAGAIGLSACASEGETVGTVGGAALGGAVGNEAGRRYEERQK